MIIRPVEPTDRAEWLRMRLTLWGGAAEELTHDIDTYFATIQSGGHLRSGKNWGRTLRVYRS
jgi:hypothetical protein